MSDIEDLQTVPGTQTEMGTKERGSIVGDEGSPATGINLHTSFIIFLKGMLMGMADIIPGVSGGTMALITGIYERLIHGIREIDFKFILYLLQRKKQAAKENFMKIDFELFIPLLIGIMTAFLLLAKLMDYLLEEQTAPTYAFFFGLIIASAGIVYKFIDIIDRRHVISGLAGFIFVVAIVGLDKLGSNHSPPVIFLSGAIAICAMILPGISGSLILLIMGQYHFMLDALNDRDYSTLITFAAGALVGIVAFSRLMDHMIKHHRSVTMAFLFGLMLGALRVPVEKIERHGDLSDHLEMTAIVVAALLGFIMVIIIERKSRQIEEKLGFQGEKKIAESRNVPNDDDKTSTKVAESKEMEAGSGESKDMKPGSAESREMEAGSGESKDMKPGSAESREMEAGFGEHKDMEPGSTESREMEAGSGEQKDMEPGSLEPRKDPEAVDREGAGERGS